MVQIRKKKAIIDSDALRRDLAGIAASDDRQGRRAALLARLKAAYSDGFDEIRDRFQKGDANGRQTAAAMAYLSDRIVQAAFDYATGHAYPRSNPTETESLTIAATGGYGRGEMAPYSDLDLLFLIPYKRTAWIENVIEFMLYLLWDMGLKVGQATRTPDDCIRLAEDDVSIRTALLEARYLAGDKELFDQTMARFQKDIVKGHGREYVEAKLAERDARHDRMGDTRYVVEPNLKEGKGGLRDLHTLYWIGKFLSGNGDRQALVSGGLLNDDEYRQFRKAENFLWSVRCALHFLTGRAEERLTFDVQPELARRFDYTDRPGLSGVERFMKHYFIIAKQVGDLTRIVCAALEARHEKSSLLRRMAPRKSVSGFKIDGGRLTVGRADTFRRNPVNMIKIFAIAQRTGYDIHPDALRLIARDLSLIDRKLRRDPDANRYFLEVLTATDRPEINLRRMNEAGVFGRFIPDFGRVVAQMQYDMYHHYTVDEHTIRAIGLLAAIERGELEDDHPLSTRLIWKIGHRRALYLGVLCHDIAKGRGGDHSEIGEKIARKLGPRLGLDAEETDLAAWLVQRHLLMSHYAFKRDISDRKTIQDFADRVKSPERLKLLVVLTVVDIRAVGPAVWNGWKGQLLRELYYAAEEVLVAGHAEMGRAERVGSKKKQLRGRLEDWSEAKLQAYMARFPDAYWIAEDPDTLEQNARLVARVEDSNEAIGVSARVEPFQEMTQVTVYTRDRPGLFSQLAGALSVAGGLVVDAKIHTTLDGMALDNFTLQSRRQSTFDAAEKLARLEQIVRDTLSGSIQPREAFESRQATRKRTDVFRVEPMVLIDNKASRSRTVVEVNARDRPGLLFDLTTALNRLRLSVISAHVATYGERAVDTFYLQERDGSKISGKQRINYVRKTLLDATWGRLIEDAGARPSRTAPTRASG